jgi:hypothetical protein
MAAVRFFSQMPDFDPNTDYYRDLGISKTAPQSEIKKKYYQLA